MTQDFEEEAVFSARFPDTEEMWDKQRAADFLGVSFYVFEMLLRQKKIKLYRYSRKTHRVRAAEVREFRDRSASGK